MMKTFFITLVLIPYEIQAHPGHAELLPGTEAFQPLDISFYVILLMLLAGIYLFSRLHSK